MVAQSFEECPEIVIVALTRLDDGAGGGPKGLDDEAPGEAPLLPHVVQLRVVAFVVSLAHKACPVRRVLPPQGQVGQPGGRERKRSGSAAAAAAAAAAATAGGAAAAQATGFDVGHLVVVLW